MFEELREKTVLVTGATGLIGQVIVNKLINLNARVIAVVRNAEKAKQKFGEDSRICFLITDINQLEIKRMEVDYIIHAASITSSKAFVSNPVDVSLTAIEGTRRTLEIARKSGVKGYVFLSSMEVYGTPQTDEKITEGHSSDVDPLRVRSAYPESKRMCESLCSSYYSQYNVPAKVVRLTQTIGPGIEYDDGRVFAEFARCVIEGRNIVLHTRGETKRSYLYSEDAAAAILTVLLYGASGDAYNAANEATYCTIYEMAQTVCKICANGKIAVELMIEDTSSMGYAPTLHMNLDTSKLQKLNWKPTTGIVEMYEKMIKDMKSRYVSKSKKENE